MSSEELPDVHSEKPAFPILVSRVGLTGVKLPPFKAGNGIFTPVFNIYVELPKHLKGAHLSRLYRVLTSNYEIMEEKGFEGLAFLAFKALEANAYAGKSYVEVYGDYLTRINDIPFHLRLGSGVSLDRATNKLEWFSEVETETVTSCPCAMKVSLHLFNTPFTHMQKAKVKVRVETDDKHISPIKIGELLTRVLNTPVNLLSRKEEAVFVQKIFVNPEFTEDVARRIFVTLIKGFKDTLDSNHYISVKVESLETIHQYHVESLITGYVKEFLNELEKGGFI
ncbi:GTP cyclohydrolase I FolE2 [Thermosphaera chiliense]|uniref:GTP cyclohydrolase I FolE2 n=1 Tax=Thermosphaera chiliense TaxID=3402707 RepID=A0A7M1UNY1_9CREN|nr:GTP cyclohydrolase, FolE2/MptA family [Thermosphaera aggregans]QOR93950.1 GTP cyclohydrolase I FolE2 [Thermosphaera aggregans]